MADEALTLTPEDIDSFMRYRSEQGGTVDSNKAYLRAMRHFYKDLQELGGRIEAGTLGLWRDLQLDRGYSPNTISAEISVVNSYLKYIGRRDLQLEPGLQLRKRERPPLTREEYLYLLRAARERGKERVYLLIKLFAQTGIAVQDLPLVTAEAVEDGEIVRGQAGESHVKIPPALRAELRSYGNRRGVFSGSFLSTGTASLSAALTCRTAYGCSAARSECLRARAIRAVCASCTRPPRTGYARDWRSSP